MAEAKPNFKCKKKNAHAQHFMLVISIPLITAFTELLVKKNKKNKMRVNIQFRFSQ